MNQEMEEHKQGYLQNLLKMVSNDKSKEYIYLFRILTL
jgi:hypothetical protein